MLTSMPKIIQDIKPIASGAAWKWSLLTGKSHKKFHREKCQKSNVFCQMD